MKGPVTTSFIFNEGKKREATLCVSDFDMCHLDFYLKNFFSLLLFGKSSKKSDLFFLPDFMAQILKSFLTTGFGFDKSSFQYVYKTLSWFFRGKELQKTCFGFWIAVNNS